MKRIVEKSAKEIAAVRDSDIDYSDIPPLDKAFWEHAKPRFPARKKLLSLRLDEDVLLWFKQQGKGYQSYMNEVLRSFVNTHISK